MIFYNFLKIWLKNFEIFVNNSIFCNILFLNVDDYVFIVENIFMKFFYSRGKMGKKLGVVEFFIFLFFNQKTVI